jgi:hypothetical protein
MNVDSPVGDFRAYAQAPHKLTPMLGVHNSLHWTLPNGRASELKRYAKIEWYKIIKMRGQK